MEKNMFDYIKETPETLLNIIDNSEKYTKELVTFYKENNCDGIYFVASGSSYNGVMCALSFMKHILKKDIRLISPFTLIHHEKDYVGNKMLIGVSQSGCSTNTLEALKVLKQDGHKTACLVGRDDCDAKDIADLTINWQVGEEKVGFVTKGVTSLACFLMVFAVELAFHTDLIDENRYHTMKERLKEAVSIHPEMVKNTIKVFNNHKGDFTKRNRVFMISSGPNLGTATEGALKIAETSCISASVYEAEEFLHGPLYPLTPDDLIIVIDNNDDDSSKRMIDIANALRDITEKVYVISNSTNFADEYSFRTSRQTCLHRSPLYKLACVQTLSYLMTEATNKYEPHENVKKFKKANKVASKSRDNLYLNLQKV